MAWGEGWVSAEAAVAAVVGAHCCYKACTGTRIRCFACSRTSLGRLWRLTEQPQKAAAKHIDAGRMTEAPWGDRATASVAPAHAGRHGYRVCGYGTMSS